MDLFKARLTVFFIGSFYAGCVFIGLAESKSVNSFSFRAVCLLAIVWSLRLLYRMIMASVSLLELQDQDSDSH